MIQIGCTNNDTLQFFSNKHNKWFQLRQTILPSSGILGIWLLGKIQFTFFHPDERVLFVLADIRLITSDEQLESEDIGNDYISDRWQSIYATAHDKSFSQHLFWQLLEVFCFFYSDRSNKISVFIILRQNSGAFQFTLCLNLLLGNASIWNTFVRNIGWDAHFYCCCITPNTTVLSTNPCAGRLRSTQFFAKSHSFDAWTRHPDVPGHVISNAAAVI